MNLELAPYDYFEELRYIWEILIAEYLLTVPTGLKRRSHFWVRFAIGTILLTGVCFIYFVLFAVYMNNPDFFVNRWRTRLVFISWYSLLIILSVVQLKFLFRESLTTLLPRALIAWCTQHVEYVIINEAMGRGFWPEVRTNYLWAYILICVVSCGLLYWGMYRIFHPLVIIDGIEPNKKSYIVYNTLFFIFLLVLTFFHQEVFSNLIETDPDTAYFAAIVDALVCIGAILGMYMVYRTNQEYLGKKEAQMLLAEREKQYQQSKEAIDIINRKSHDLKHQVRALKTMDVEKRDAALSDVEKSLSIYDSSFHTGNEVLDTILTEKSLLAEKEHIRLTAIVDPSCLANMDPLDLYVLFGNAIDNALEACEKLPPEQEKVVSIHIAKEHGMDSIQIENTFDGKLLENGNDLLTSKSNKEYHGYGYRSIREIAEKYHGVAVHETEGNLFLLHILIPVSSF